MKAVVYTQYGPPEVLQHKEVEKPTPTDNDILIKMHAATVAAADVNARGFVNIPKGFRTSARLMFGIRRPRRPILGMELAGEVEAVGKDVERFKVGDQVFGQTGIHFGAYAEYVVLPEDKAVATMPSNLSYQEAVALPIGGLTALYFLRKGKVQPGQKVLIYGASGSVGTYAVQLAKYFGAEVTGVCSTTNLDMVKSLGADHVIDYTQENFTQNGQTYDIIFDTVGKKPYSQCKHALTPNGIFLAGAGGPGVFVQMLWTSLFGSKKVIAGVPPENVDELIFLKELVEAGEIKPVVDRTYPMEEIVAAHRYVDTGRKKGNVVITVAPNGPTT